MLVFALEDCVFFVLEACLFFFRRLAFSFWKLAFLVFLYTRYTIRGVVFLWRLVFFCGGVFFFWRLGFLAHSCIIVGVIYLWRLVFSVDSFFLLTGCLPAFLLLTA